MAETILFLVSNEDRDYLDRWFGPRSVETELQAVAIGQINTKAKELCLTILRSVPKCADRSAAIRKIREATGTVIEAVFHEEGAYLNRTPIRNG